MSNSWLKIKEELVPSWRVEGTTWIGRRYERRDGGGERESIIYYTFIIIFVLEAGVTRTARKHWSEHVLLVLKLQGQGLGRWRLLACTTAHVFGGVILHKAHHCSAYKSRWRSRCNGDEGKTDRWEVDLCLTLFSYTYWDIRAVSNLSTDKKNKKYNYYYDRGINSRKHLRTLILRIFSPATK